MKVIIIKIFSLYILFLSGAGAILADEIDRSISFNYDNDSFIGTDRSYTGGYQINWVIPGSKISNKFFSSKLFNNNGEYRFFTGIAFSLGRSVFTPDDITQSELLVDDRPYAGYNYFNAIVFRNNYRFHESFEISFGLVGPHTYSKQVQTFIHEKVGSDIPKGWNNQLKDELILQLFYERIWKIKSHYNMRNFGVEFISDWSSGLGNAFIYGQFGLLTRFGFNIPNDFGIEINRPGEITGVMPRRKDSFGIYGFITTNIFFNIRNIFLDGPAGAFVRKVAV